MNQATFYRALLNPDLPVPAGLIDAGGRPAGSRFSVYRNNVTSGLTEVLQMGFPVLQKLLGEAYFKALAVSFLRENPPTSRIMMLYGAAMPGFLENFPPLAHLPYLADVARLEQALRCSYHAADAPPIDAARLSALSPEAFMAARLELAPALQLIGRYTRSGLSTAARGQRRPGCGLRPPSSPAPSSTRNRICCQTAAATLLRPWRQVKPSARPWKQPPGPLTSGPS